METPSQIQENTCVETTRTLKIPPEQLRKSLADHRNSLLKRCFELKQVSMRIEKDIESIDAILADLTTG